MLYRTKLDIIIRGYCDVGYIANKNGFGVCVTHGLGAAFLFALFPYKTLDDITDEIAKKFVNINKNVLQRGIIEFYKMLEEDGFIVSGKTPAELDAEDTHTLKQTKQYDSSVNKSVDLTIPNDDYNDDFTAIFNWAYKHKCRAVTHFIMMACYGDTCCSLKHRCGACVDSLSLASNIYPCADWHNDVLDNSTGTRLKEKLQNTPNVKNMHLLKNMKYLDDLLRKKNFIECINCPESNFCAVSTIHRGNKNQKLSHTRTISGALVINKHFCATAVFNRQIAHEWRSLLQV